MQICWAVVCKLSVYQLKLNYLGHRFLLFFSCHEVSSFRLFQRCQWLLSWLFYSDWWLTTCFFVPLFYKQNLNRANEEIAQVRTKAKAESAALHAGLRKEQMKVESLERALQQKVRRGVWPQRPRCLSFTAASLRWIWRKEASPFCPDTLVQFLEPVHGGNTQANQEIPRHILGTVHRQGSERKWY